MKNKHLLILVAFFAVLIYACKKEHVFENGQATNAAIKFTVSNAKSYLDSALKTNSTTIKLSGTQGSSKPAAFDGHLFWDKAKAFSTNRFEVVEVPLALDYKETSFYKLGGDTSAYVTDKAVGEAAFARALIYRDSTQKIIDKRIITYIPDKSYLAKNPDPSANNWLNSMDKKFSGYIEYRNWGNEVNMVVRILAGKVVHVYNVSAAPNNDAAGVKTQGLKTNDLTCITYRVGSSVTACFGGYCSTTFKGYEYHTICSSPSDDDNFNHNRPPMPPADWQPVYSEGGGGGGGGGGTSTITNNIVDKCLNSMVADIIKKDIKFNVNETLNSIFNTNKDFNLNFKDMPLSSNTDGVTDLISGNTQLGALNIEITLNSSTLPNASKEYIAATILHESLHAYFRYNNAILDHQVMSTNYIGWFEKSMKNMFPNLSDYDNESLAWGGLYTTFEWSQKDSSSKNFALQINKSYKDGTSGVKCQ